MLSIHSELRSPNAVSSAPTRAIAPPQWRMITSVSADGRAERPVDGVIDRGVREAVEVERLPVVARPAGKYGSSERWKSR